MGYHMVKNYNNMLSLFHLIPERHGQTDGQTDRRTELLTRDKNGRSVHRPIHPMCLGYIIG